LAFHVSKQRFAELVEEALAELPEPFASKMEEISVEIREKPDPEQLRHLGLSEDQLLMGLYVGHPLTQRSVELSGTLPDRVYIFQEDIEQVCDTEEHLVDEVRATVLHEIGHFFGLDEEELDDLGFG
jgi:predicted Zn-dependent protease with MMP-like domain